MGKEDRRRVWWLYGWFTALMACGSCVGTQMLLLVNLFQAEKNDNSVQSSLFYAASYTWHPVFTVTYAVEFLCLSAAKLMVLDRLMVFAAPQGVRLQKRWAAAGRVVMAALVLDNAVGWRPTLQLQCTITRLLRAWALHLRPTLQTKPMTATSYFHEASKRSSMADPSHPCSPSARLPCCSSLSYRLL